MSLAEFYAAIGGDISDVLSRLPDERIVLKYVRKFPSDPTYAYLLSAFETESREKAFLAAHTLKGLCLNLGFTELYRISSALCEKLRNENADLTALRPLLLETTEAYGRVLSAVGILEPRNHNPSNGSENNR